MIWLNNIRISVLIWALTALLLVVAAISVGTSVIAVSGADRLKETWTDYDEQTAQKSEYLGQLRDALGYGGMIHQFKNYILRQDAKRHAKIKIESEKPKQVLADYRRLVNADTELAALDVIADTIDQYAKAADVAERMAHEGATPREVDAVVKIDDTPALDALEILDEHIYEQRLVSVGRVSAAIGGLRHSAIIGMSVILALVMILIASFFWFAIARVITPLRSLGNVISVLASGDIQAEIPYIDRKDEVGDLSRSVSEINALSRAAQRIEAALDATAIATMVTDADYKIIYANPAMRGILQRTEDFWCERVPGFSADNIIGVSIDSFHHNPEQKHALLSDASEQHDAEISVGDFAVKLCISPVHDSDGARLGHVLSWIDRTSERDFEAQIDAVIAAARSGDFSARIDVSDATTAITSSADGINNLCQDIHRFLQDIEQALSGLSNGDLTSAVGQSYEGQLGDIATSVDRTAHEIDRLIGKVVHASGEITRTSATILEDASDLSSRAGNQAASLEETAAAMEEISATVKTNADNAIEANTLASLTCEQAARGREVVAETVQAMANIRESSSEIGEIISTIEAIAFQTNLLALNAAVEAARAGDAGKGFAVVAAEVRTLAQRSSEAAMAIKDLISKSAERVKAGDSLVSATDAALAEILSGVQKVGNTIEEIANASKEQSTGVEEVSITVCQMDELTQQNAALADRSAAAARNLTNQSESLTELVGFFTTGSNSEIISVKPDEKALETWDKDAEADLAAAKKPANAARPDLAAGGNWAEF